MGQAPRPVDCGICHAALAAIGDLSRAIGPKPNLSVSAEPFDWPLWRAGCDIGLLGQLCEMFETEVRARPAAQNIAASCMKLHGQQAPDK